MKLEQPAPFSVNKTATKGRNNPVFTGNARSLAILDKLVPQENLGKERKPKMRENKALRGLQAAFRELVKKDWRNIIPDEDYGDICKKVKSCAYAAEDVYFFSLTLAQFQDVDNFAEKAGVFLSALINEGDGKRYAISTRNLSFGISHLGYRNTKTITVDGNTGRETGLYMAGGRIVVNGNVGARAGLYMAGGRMIVRGNAGYDTGEGMAGGQITVNGNAGTGVGMFMKGGGIIVDGNADDFAGEQMKCGKIAVRGNIGSLGLDIKGGDIYQRKKQIVRNGEKIADIENK